MRRPLVRPADFVSIVGTNSKMELKLIILELKGPLTATEEFNNFGTKVKLCSGIVKALGGKEGT